MRTSTKLLLAMGVAALTGSAALADALPGVRQLIVRLPGGGTEELSYTGDIAPEIVFLPDAARPQTLIPAARYWAAFTGLDRISAEMDHVAAAMDREIAVAMRELQSTPLAVQNGVIDTAIRSVPAGTESYSFVSTINGRNVCTQEVQVTGMGNGAKPKVVSRSSGNCRSAPSLDNRPSDNAHLLSTSAPVPEEISVRGPHI